MESNNEPVAGVPAPININDLSVDELKVLAFDTLQELQQKQNFYNNLLQIIAQKMNLQVVPS